VSGSENFLSVPRVERRSHVQSSAPALRPENRAAVRDQIKDMKGMVPA